MADATAMIHQVSHEEFMQKWLMIEEPKDAKTSQFDIVMYRI